jgi:hypothetical protein
MWASIGFILALEKTRNFRLSWSNILTKTDSRKAVEHRKEHRE